MTYKLRPSPLYMDKWSIPDNVSEYPLRTILETGGTISPDLQVWMNNKGIGMYEGDIIKSVHEQFNVRQVKKMFHNWKETGYDKRRSCR